MGYFRLIFIIIAVVGNFYFSIFFRLTWGFLGLESERGGSVCWPNNKIIDLYDDTNCLFRSSYSDMQKITRTVN